MGKARLAPKTSAVRVTGTCGHEFSNRYPVPVSLRGKPLEGQVLEDFQKWKASTASVIGSAECLDCQASRSLTSTRASVTAWSQWLRVAELPPLDASSVRMLAFAEGVRAGLLGERLTAIALAGAEAFREEDLSHRLLGELLKARWPDERWVDARDPSVGSPAGHALVQVLPQGMHAPSWMHMNRRATPQQTLALWILGRAAWPGPTHDLFGKRDAREWVLAHRYRRRESSVMAQGDLAWRMQPEFLACRIVASLGHWGEPSEAWDAFVGLCSPRVAEMVGSAIASEDVAPGSLPDLIQMGVSMAAISGMTTNASVNEAKLARVLGRI